MDVCGIGSTFHLSWARSVESCLTQKLIREDIVAVVVWCVATVCSLKWTSAFQISLNFSGMTSDCVGTLFCLHKM